MRDIKRKQKQTGRMEVRYLLSWPEYTQDKPVKLGINFVQAGAISLSKRTTTEGVKEAILPWVTQVAWSFPPAVAVTPTHEDMVVETKGWRIGNVTFGGEVGFLLAYDKQGQFYEHPTVAYLRDVIALCERAVDPTGPGYLTLWAIEEGTAWKVVPERWALNRNPRNKTGLSWQLRFVVIGKAKPPSRALESVEMFKESKRKKTWAQVAMDTIAQAQDRLQKIDDATLGWARQQRDNIRGIIRDANATLQQATNMARKATELLRSPADLIRQLIGAGMNVAFAAKMLYVGTKRFLVERYGGFAGLSDAFDLSPELSADVAQPPLPEDDSLAASTSVANESMKAGYEDLFAIAISAQDVLAPQQIHVTANNETVEQIALKFYGGATEELLTAIANANNLELPIPPFPAGTVLRIPFVGGTTEAKMIAVSPPEVGAATQEEGLGVDFELGADGDLVVAKAGDDLELTSGVDLVLQDLRVRLVTEQGANLLWPDLGLPIGIGQEMTAAVQARLARVVTDLITMDDRVGQIADLGVEALGDKVEVSATITVRGQKLALTVTP